MASVLVTCSIFLGWLSPSALPSLPRTHFFRLSSASRTKHKNDILVSHPVTKNNGARFPCFWSQLDLNYTLLTPSWMENSTTTYSYVSQHQSRKYSTSPWSPWGVLLWVIMLQKFVEKKGPFNLRCHDKHGWEIPEYNITLWLFNIAMENHHF